jgi:hypothetical protein
MNRAYFLTAALLALTPCISSAQGTWSLKVPGQPLEVSGKMRDALNVSGAASVAAGRVLLVCDELKRGVQAGHIALATSRMTVTEGEFTLLAGAGKELDLEAAAADPQHPCYYVCGSCGTSRKTGAAAPDRQWLFRIGTDPASGTMIPGAVTRVSLVDALRTDAFLAEHSGKSAPNMGVDIEGLAYKDGRLWFGLRCPNVNGCGLVVVASADDLMAKRPVVWQRFDLPLGVDRGLRDLAPITDGFLLLAGPTGALDAKTAPTKRKNARPAAQSQPAPPPNTVSLGATADARGREAGKMPAPRWPGHLARYPLQSNQVLTEPSRASPPAAATPEVASFALYFWAGDASKPVRVGEVPRLGGGKDASAKPEGLLVVSETSASIGLIVFSDGAANGAPMLYEVSRPKWREHQQDP